MQKISCDVVTSKIFKNIRCADSFCVSLTQNCDKHHNKTTKQLEIVASKHRQASASIGKHRQT
jgi:hypothetical protein